MQRFTGRAGIAERNPDACQRNLRCGCDGGIRCNISLGNRRHRFGCILRGGDVTGTRSPRAEFSQEHDFDAGLSVDIRKRSRLCEIAELREPLPITAASMPASAAASRSAIVQG